MFYRLLFAITALLTANQVFAQESPRFYTSASAGASAAAQASAASRSSSRSFSQGGNSSSQAVNNANNSNNSQFNERKQAPGIGIPSLTSGAITCLGSVSGGFSVSGFGGGLGATYLERNCESRMVAEQIYRYGYRRQAINLLIAEHPMVYRAFTNTASAAATARRPVVYGKKKP